MEDAVALESPVQGGCVWPSRVFHVRLVGERDGEASKVALVRPTLLAFAMPSEGLEKDATSGAGPASLYDRSMALGLTAPMISPRRLPGDCAKWASGVSSPSWLPLRCCCSCCCCSMTRSELNATLRLILVTATDVGRCFNDV